MHVAARLIATNGMTYMTPEIRDVALVRPGLSVEMCLPRNVPPGWVTRKSPMEQKFEVRGDLSKATQARGMVRTWGENEPIGGWINDVPFPLLEEPSFSIETGLLRPGINSLKHAQGGLGGHHGMEICWPGIVILIQYEE
jgi:hypothetical protein